MDHVGQIGAAAHVEQVKDQEGAKSTIFQPNLGIGIRLKNLTIDYALTNIGSQETLYSNVFSPHERLEKQLLDKLNLDL